MPASPLELPALLFEFALGFVPAWWLSEILAIEMVPKSPIGVMVALSVALELPEMEIVGSDSQNEGGEVEAAEKEEEEVIGRVKVTGGDPEAARSGSRGP
jgi:hypothetical protein